MEKTTRATENMHKFVYLANEYKGAKLQKMFEMFQMPLVDFNAAVWLAEDLGYIEIEKRAKSEDRVKVLALPETFEFGQRVRDLTNTLTYIFNRLAKDKTDLTEDELNSWMVGYPTHDQLVAMKVLINKGVLEDYIVTTRTLKGATDNYTFYSLAENASKRWGRKQFADQTRLVEEAKEV